MRIILYAILAYILFQFIFRLVIPLFIATRRFKKGFREMKDRMNQQQGQAGMNGPQNFTNQSGSAQSSARSKTGDYIDFEEVK